MQLTPGRLALAGVLLSSFLAGTVQAQDDDSPELKVELSNTKDGKGSSFRIDCKTQPLPDGAQLVVTISARGKTRDYMCKIMRVVVANSRFVVQESWPSRRLAPLLYVVKVDLDLRKQTPENRQWLQTEYGYAPTHHQTIHELKQQLGTDEERAEFAIVNLGSIEKLALRLQELLENVKTITAQPASENPEYRQQQKATYKLLGEFRTAVDAHFKGYVILVEQGLCKRLQRGVAKLSTLVRAFGRGRARKLERALNGFALEFASNVDLVRRMKPADTNDPLIPDEKEGD